MKTPEERRTYFREYQRARQKIDPEYRARKADNTARWRAENTEAAKRFEKEYRSRPEVKAKRAARMRARRAKDPAYRRRERAVADRWRANNPDRIFALNKRYRARSLGARGDATDAQIAARVAFYFGRCAYCGGPYEHLDHVIPLSRGGTAWPANLRPACRKCNLSKRDKLLSEWRSA